MTFKITERSLKNDEITKLQDMQSHKSNSFQDLSKNYKSGTL